MNSNLRHFAQRALSNDFTVSATYWHTRMVLEYGAQGDLVECGVFAGTQIAAMAQACTDAGERRTIHLFDSFQGIPKAGENDSEIAGLVGYGGVNEPSGVSVCGVEAVRKHLDGWGFSDYPFVFHEGWFSDTVPAAKIDRIALLRLDGDLYESTKVCLDHFYPKLSRGGVCIVDDFELDGCRKAVTEYFGGKVPGPIAWCKS